MPTVLYTQEVAWSPAIYIKDSPHCRGKYRILPLATWMVAARQLTNFLLPHSMWFVAAWEWMYAASLSQISYFDTVTGHAGPTAAACWHIKVYPLPKQIWTCIQTIQAVARRLPAWISYYFIFSWLYQGNILSQIKTSTLDIAREYKHCSWNVPPEPSLWAAAPAVPLRWPVAG